MVEVFKTNVQLKEQAEIILGILSNYFPDYKMNFDLYDCDYILRIEGATIVPEKIIEVLISNCCCCELLN